MKPVFQTTFGIEGNCLCACIASIFEIDINEVPNPKHDNWQDEVNEWMVNNFGVYFITANIAGEHLPAAMMKSYTIGCSKSINGLIHAVICKGGKIVHDPLPNSGVVFEMINRFDLLVKHF